MSTDRLDAGPPPDDQADRLPQQPVEDLGARNFAGAPNFAADQRHQRDERGAGLGAGGSDARDANHPAQGEGEVAEDDID